MHAIDSRKGAGKRDQTDAHVVPSVLENLQPVAHMHAQLSFWNVTESLTAKAKQPDCHAIRYARLSTHLKVLLV